MDYIKLAWELEEVKRSMVKAKNLHRITDPGASSIARQGLQARYYHQYAHVRRYDGECYIDSDICEQ